MSPKQRGTGFQKRTKPNEFKDVRLAVVKQDRETVYCSCDWEFKHPREKVREDAIDRHLNKRHGGRGIRL